MAVYERYSGAFLAERIQAEPGSDEDKALAALAENRTDGWRCVDDDAPPRKTKRATAAPPAE